jgi:hypothetical protein
VVEIIGGRWQGGVTRNLDPTGRGQQRWTVRWKPALNAFAITFANRIPASTETKDTAGYTRISGSGALSVVVGGVYPRRMRCWRSVKLARPYIWRLSILVRVFTPSVRPL